MIVVIDCHGIGHRVKHSMHGLSHHDKQTGVIFGFLRYVLKYAKMFSTKNFVFAWDSKKSYRYDLYPEYKANRNGDREFTEEEKQLYYSAINQFHVLRKTILPTLGFRNNFIQTGVEADDIIAKVVKSVKTQQALTDLVVVSRDNDLWQLLEWCDILDPANDKVLTKDAFVDTHNIQPRQWADVKCLAGCTTDNVKGIHGVGEAKALQYISGRLVKGKVFDKIQSPEGQAIVDRNKKLIHLPFHKTKNFRLDFEEKFSLSDFERVCEDYGLNSFLNLPAYNEWRKWFLMT